MLYRLLLQELSCKKSESPFPPFLAFSSLQPMQAGLACASKKSSQASSDRGIQGAAKDPQICSGLEYLQHIAEPGKLVHWWHHTLLIQSFSTTLPTKVKKIRGAPKAPGFLFVLVLKYLLFCLENAALSKSADGMRGFYLFIPLLVFCSISKTMCENTERL